MQQTIEKLENIVINYAALLKNINEDEFIFIPAPGKWSK